MMKLFKQFSTQQGMNADEPGLKELKDIIDSMHQLPGFADMMNNMGNSNNNNATATATSTSSTPVASTTSSVAAAAAASSSSSSSGNENTSFQSTIDQMMQEVSQGAKNMKVESGLGDFDMSKMDEMFKKAFADVSASDIDLDDKDNMEKMMADLGDFGKTFFNKAAIKPAIVDLTAKFPEWLAKNKSTCPDAEYTLYCKQYECYQRMCVALDAPGDSMDEVVALMSEIQSYGSPPKEILDQLIPEGAPQMPSLPQLPPELANMSEQDLQKCAPS